MKRTRILPAGAAVVAASLLLSGCGGTGADTASDTLNIATMTVPSSLDPVDATGSALPYFQAVYDTLIKRAPDGSYEPMLATEWSYNDDRTVLSLTLRDDVAFADGTALDADAVTANLLRFRDGGGTDSANLAGVTDVTAVDATHVDIVMDAPNPGLEFYLSDSAGLMANPAGFEDEDALKTTPDGTGPYRLDADGTVIGTKWVFDKNDEYWDSELPFDTVTISAFDNENAIVNGLKTGQIDTALLQSVDQQIAAEADTALTSTPTSFDFQGLFLFDRDGAVTPELGDVRVRQAINYALDRQTMLDQIMQGRGAVTSQVFGVNAPGYEESLDEAYPHDPAKAKELLAEAGYADGISLTLPRMAAIVSDPLASAIQTSLAEAGIELTWEDLDQATALQRIFSDREFSGTVLNIGQSSNDWIVIQSLILPGTFNMFGSTDPEVQSLVESIRSASADDAVTDVRALNEHIVEEAWFAPFYRVEHQLVTDAGVTAEPQSGLAVPSIYNYAPAK
ncbi:ABC transporter substrate-binding protein [Mycetocola reblochoni]|uniref:Dipeptide-binding ABC transporter, periplasmic substrate-binding component (TC 3.A.1.5.2) n=2 Tax=Mycetocola reblochoni TaxID=331618 RepID=A0A1R4J1Q3_9MICO|nr:ABC transporter substrate-binding protein [Mycetocola reblochoni]RLP71224.1 ABC transporter substrate-binding protein [Mycetocola reblochoni]SJN25918.1 Dipeptide-binding ABC transporter, periplasmic substrate-binding component (TC 3.A.1.5.2) [Mycetocola reblochoni REB411]